MMNDLPPAAIEGEEFSIEKLLQNVDLDALKPHQNDTLGYILEVFEEYDTDDLAIILSIDELCREKFKELTEKICGISLMSLADDKFEVKSVNEYFCRLYKILSSVLMIGNCWEILDLFMILLKVIDCYCLTQNNQNSKNSQTLFSLSKPFQNRILTDMSTLLNPPLTPPLSDLPSDYIHTYLLLSSHSHPPLTLPSPSLPWYSLLTYHCLNFTTSPTHPPSLPPTLLKFITKYFYTVNPELMHKMKDKDLGRIGQVFEMYMSVMGWKRVLERLEVVLEGLGEGRVYPEVWRVDDVERLRQVRFGEVMESEILEDEVLDMLIGQSHFIFLTELWEHIVVSYESYNVEHEEFERRYEFFMNLNFLPIEQSLLWDRIQHLPEFKDLDISQVVTIEELPNYLHQKQAKQSISSSPEEIKEQIAYNEFDNTEQIVRNISEEEKKEHFQVNKDRFKDCDKEETKQHFQQEIIEQVQQVPQEQVQQEPQEQIQQESQEQVNEGLQEQIQEEQSQIDQPQQEDDWEADEDKAFLQTFTSDYENLMPKEVIPVQVVPQKVAQNLPKDHMKEDTRIFSAFESIFQIRTAIQYFCSSDMPIDQTIAEVERLRKDNLQTAQILQDIIDIYNLPDLRMSAKSLIARWMYNRLKTQTPFISRDFFLSCMKKPTSELSQVDKQRYSMLLSALLISDQKKDDCQVSPEQIKSLMSTAGIECPEQSLWLSLISDPYTLEKFDRGIWTFSISDVLAEADQTYTKLDGFFNIENFENNGIQHQKKKKTHKRTKQSNWKWYARPKKIIIFLMLLIIAVKLLKDYFNR